MLVAGDMRRSIRVRYAKPTDLHPLLVVDLEDEERAARQRERRERRRQALERPAARAESLLAEVELDVYFDSVDKLDAAILRMDELAVEEEFREDDEPA